MSAHRRKFPEQKLSDLATPYSECAETVQRLHAAVVDLDMATAARGFGRLCEVDDFLYPRVDAIWAF